MKLLSRLKTLKKPQLKNSHRIALATAGVATVAAASIGTGAALAAHAQPASHSPRSSDTTTTSCQSPGELLKWAVLPDRSVGGFIDAALDGSASAPNPWVEGIKGIGIDTFELVVNPGKAVYVAVTDKCIERAPL